MKKKDVIIIGGGAAGLMCAAVAGKRNRTVLVIESSDKAGSKILISGGGRCNFTNINTSPNNFISHNPHFSKSALAGYTQEDFTGLVKKYNIPFHEKKLGQLFCDNTSKDILSMLEEECKINHAEILTGCRINKISKNNFFEIETVSDTFQSESLVIASGGISIPKMGATDFGYKVAKQFDIGVTDIYPGLVPVLFDEKDRMTYSGLSGISIDSEVKIKKSKFRENILFTHKGLSGPAILQISSYLKPGDSISINLLPENNLLKLFESDPKSELSDLLSGFLPNRFVSVFCESVYKSKTISTISKKDSLYISDKIHNWINHPAGTEGFDKAEVTAGGINTDELSSKTMESKKIKGLYFIGEVVDVTGWLGGYNFQWAWSSGYAAGQYV